MAAPTADAPLVDGDEEMGEEDAASDHGDDAPGAELLVLADASHAALIEQPETINHRLDRFIRERLA